MSAPRPGRRRTRLWTIKEAIGVRAVAVLRKAGCSLQQIRAAQAAIDRDPALRDTNATLVWNGTQVLVVHEDGAVESLLRYPGQLVFRAVALPIGLWSEETDKALSYVWDDELPQGKVYSSRELALAARPPATAAS